MTNIIFAIIDNHKKYRKTKYDILFRTTNYKEYIKYVKCKGLD
jgi:hypothetical protein